MRQRDWGKRKGNSYIRACSLRTLYGYATFFNGVKYVDI